jgi:hypothetical protein
MKPFTAWLAMSIAVPGDAGRQRMGQESRGCKFEAFDVEATAIHESPAPPQPVLIVADTEENRKKLGMEAA